MGKTRAHQLIWQKFYAILDIETKGFVGHNDVMEKDMQTPWLNFFAAITLGIAAAQAHAAEGLELADESGCLNCHAVEKKVVGPAWQDVANRYKGQSEISATLTDGTTIKGSPKDVLNQKIHKGGKGNWTAVTGGLPMPPYSPKVSDADIAKLVDFVLGLAK